jgi:hypothetical protein
MSIFDSILDLGLLYGAIRLGRGVWRRWHKTNS